MAVTLIRALVACAVGCQVACLTTPAPPGAAADGAIPVDDAAIPPDGHTEPGTDAAIDAPPGSLVIVSRTPMPGDEQVNARAPIAVVFSAAIDSQSAIAAVTLTAADKDVAIDVAPDGDRTLSVTIKEPPAVPAIMTLAISTALHGAQGEAFAGDEWSWTVPVWRRLGDSAAPATATAVRLALQGDTPVITYFDHQNGATSAVATRWNGSAFETVASSELKVTAVTDAALAINFDGKIALAFTDGDGALRVIRQSGATFESLTPEPLSKEAASPALVTVSTGHLVAAFVENSTLVADFFTGSEWQVAIDEGPTVVADLDVAVTGATLFAATTERSILPVAGISVYRGQLLGTWEDTGPCCGSSGTFTGQSQPSIVANAAGVGVAWKDNGDNAIDTAFLSGDTWAPGGTASTPGAASPDVAAAGTRVLTAWVGTDNAVYVSERAQTDTGWSTLPVVGPSLGEHQLAVDEKGVPLVLRSGNQSEPVLVRYNGRL